MNMNNMHPLKYSIHTRLREFHLKRLLRGSSCGRLLDIGCGLGYLTETLGNSLLRVGLDCDAGSLRENCERGMKNMVQADAGKLPFKEQSFDVVICSELLEHLKEGSDAIALSEMARVLRPGGRLLITVPALEGMRSRSLLRNLGHDDPSGGEYHYRSGYACQEIEDMVCAIPALRLLRKQYSMFLFSELFMDTLKWAYLKKNKLKNHSDIMQVADSPLFFIYRAIFPLLYTAFVCEDLILASVLKGHILIAAIERVDKK